MFTSPEVDRAGRLARSADSAGLSGLAFDEALGDSIAFMKLLPALLAFLALAPAPPLRAQAPGAGSRRPWLDYRAIMWVGDSARRKPEKHALFVERLREMGINTAMVHGEGDPAPWVESRFPYYVENIVNKGLCLKWSSTVRDWDEFVTRWAKTSRPESAFLRDYCLDDPAWRSWARSQMQRSATRHRQHQPVAYDIRDELSVTVSANPFDYDFNPGALAAFRKWLQRQYGDLAGLNRQWETRFASWDEVRPFSTDRMKNRMASGEALPRGQPDWQALQRLRFDPAAARKQPTRWNFSPWCDFRAYMDHSLSETLADLRQAAREADAATPVGIEGTQMPHAFGGYDLWRLSQALDWVEPYDIGAAREIFGSFMPGKPILCTVFEKETRQASRRLWHLLLEGDRGCIVWWSEDCIDWQSPDYALTPKARALAPVLQEMTSPLARLFLRARRERDPIAIHYSQPSIQVDWLLESTGDGSTWHRRFSSFEANHNRMAKVRSAWLKALNDLGYSPVFLSAAQIENGALRPEDWAVLVLPNSLALSGKEAAAIRGFAQSSPRGATRGLVLADGSPGLFDEHGRLQANGSLEDLFPAGGADACRAAGGAGATQRHRGDIALHLKQRLSGQIEEGLTGWIGEQLKALGRADLQPEVTVPAASRTRVHRFRAGKARLVAFERNILYHMSEDLKQAGGNEALEQPAELEARLARPAHVYDLRARKYLGHISTVAFRLDPWRPTLLALLDEPGDANTMLERLLAQTEGATPAVAR